MFNNRKGERFVILLSGSFFAFLVLLYETLYAAERTKITEILEHIQINQMKINAMKATGTVKVWWDKKEYPAFIKAWSGSSEVSPPSPETEAFVWWREGSKMRLDIKDLKTGKTQPRLLFDGERYIAYWYVTDGRFRGISSSFKRGDLIQVIISKEPLGTEGLVQNLFSPLEALGLYIGKEPLPELFRDSQAKLLGSENLEGSPCYVIDISRTIEATDEVGKKFKYKDKKRLWIDAKGYQLRKIATYFDNEVRYQTEFRRFKKFPGDIWLPLESEATIYSLTTEFRKHIPIIKYTTIFEEIQVNQGIPQDIFSFSPENLPEGVGIVDEIKGIGYKVGEKLPTDSDILKIAEVARKFRQGHINLKYIEKEFGPNKGKKAIGYCGPNSLLAVCGILGVKASSKEIAKLAGADEKGSTSIAGLKRAAEALGLKAEGMDLTLDELRKTNKLAIALLPPGHYIVVVGFSDDKVVIIDPPTVLAAVPIYGLDELWDGRALLISKP
ncbi:hypothetical protein H5T87_08710 [bacterium]|nr:hypothetical protein [bacterium]